MPVHSSVTTSHALEPVRFGHAWCNSDGVPQSTVQLGALTVLITRVEDADAGAEAFQQAAAEMRRMKPAHKPALAVMDEHALILEPHGEDFIGRCACGDPLGDQGPTTNLNHFAGPWADHLEQQITGATP